MNIISQQKLTLRLVQFIGAGQVWITTSFTTTQFDTDIVVIRDIV